MIFSLLRVPTCRIHSLANYWDETFHCLSKTYGNNSRARLLGSTFHGLELEEQHSKKWNRRPVTTKAEGSAQTTGRTKSRTTKHETLREKILTSATVNVNKTQLVQFQEVQYRDIQQEIAKNKYLSDLVTVIVFDLETTGFSREGRIIEVGFRVLRGGENSTFHTLVNPQCYVPNSRIHGITTQMVNTPDVPRMEDLIPILLKYIQSFQKPGGYVLLIAHNARRFDVPFLIKEFSRCSAEIPPNWLFVDTLPLARELVKSGGTNLSSTSLAALSELYGIKVGAPAHRAMEDVNTLSMILPRLTTDLKLTLSGLVQKSFTESDLINSKRKKKNSN